jgi:hypothetical protein
VPCLFLSVVSLVLLVSLCCERFLAVFSLLFLLCCLFLSVAGVFLLFSLVLFLVDRYRALLVSLCCGRFPAVFSCVVRCRALFVFSWCSLVSGFFCSLLSAVCLLLGEL